MVECVGGSSLPASSRTSIGGEAASAGQERQGPFNARGREVALLQHDARVVLSDMVRKPSHDAPLHIGFAAFRVSRLFSCRVCD